MAERAGGVAALAVELHTTRNSLFLWATDQRRPHEAIVAAVNAWAVRHHLKPPFTKEKRSPALASSGTSPRRGGTSKSITNPRPKRATE
jgi:hypothetical protein